MLSVRKNVFETNSSSTHAICISQERRDVPKKIHFSLGNFGWGYDVLNTPEERASYLFSGILYNYDIEESAQKIRLLKEILKSYGVEKITFDSVNIDFAYNEIDWYYNNFYVDHGCELEDLIEEMLNHNSSMLMDFLFGDGSFIIVSNDNTENDWDQILKENKKSDSYYETYWKGN